MCSFSLAAFKIFPSFWDFRSLVKMYLHIVLFVFILIRAHWIFLWVDFFSFFLNQILEISNNYFFLCPSLSFLSTGVFNYMYVGLIATIHKDRVLRHWLIILKITFSLCSYLIISIDLFLMLFSINKKCPFVSLL